MTTTRTMIGVLGLIGLFFGVLVWPNGWVYEDAHWLANLTGELGPLRAVRDITPWTLQINTRLFGSNPTGFHLTNVGVHLLNGVLVWRLSTRLAGTATGLLSAWIFLVHPLQFEAVAYVSGRGDLLSTTGTLIALTAAAQGGGAILKVVGVLTGLVLAVCAKPSGVVAGGLLFWWALVTVKVSRNMVAAFLGAVTVSATIAIQWTAIGRLMDRPSFSLDFMGRQAVALWHMIALSVWPFWPLQFSVDHDYALIDAGVLAAAVLAIVALAWYLVASRTRYPVAVIGIGWVLAAMVPRFFATSVYLPGDQYETLHEKHFYLAAIGTSLVLGHIASTLGTLTLRREA